MSRNSSRITSTLLRSAGGVLLALALALGAFPVSAAVPTRPAEPAITADSAIVIDYDSLITRQEIMVILDRTLAAARTTAAGLFTGSNGMLRPTAPATRAEGATLIERVLKLIPA